MAAMRVLSRGVWCTAVIAGCVLASPLEARQFDLIYADHVRVRQPVLEPTFHLPPLVLLVNTTDTPMSSDEIAHVTLQSVASVSFPWIEFTGIPPWDLVAAGVSQLLPAQALGSVLAGNSLLTSALRPGESLVNVAPLLYQDPIVHNERGDTGSWSIELIAWGGQDFALVYLTLDLGVGPASTEILSVSRASSEAAVEVRASTWGAIKRLYR